MRALCHRGRAVASQHPHTPVPRPPVLPQLRRRLLRAGRAVCGHAGPPAPPALPLPGRACPAARPPALWGAALPHLVHLFLERSEAWGVAGVERGDAGPSPALTPPAPRILPQCSEACGGGEQQRLVTCPEPGLCEEGLRPNSTQPCNTHPCTQWVVGPWSQVRAGGARAGPRVGGAGRGLRRWEVPDSGPRPSGC